VRPAFSGAVLPATHFFRGLAWTKFGIYWSTS
jgi:hypothetical protein